MHAYSSPAAHPVPSLPQVELATILKFVLDNEEGLSENLEIFLQKRGGFCGGGDSPKLAHHITQNSRGCWH